MLLPTTTMPCTKIVIDALREKGMRGDFVVLVGGVPLNRSSDRRSAPTPAAATAKDFMARKHNQMAASQ